MLTLTHTREAGAVAFFSGAATLALEGVSFPKLIGAFLIAMMTGAGYKVGTIIIEWFKTKFSERKAKAKK